MLNLEKGIFRGLFAGFQTFRAVFCFWKFLFCPSLFLEQFFRNMAFENNDSLQSISVKLSGKNFSY